MTNKPHMPYVDLTEEEIQEFKQIVKKVYGIDLTDDEARDQGSRIILLFELLIKNKQKQNQQSQNQILPTVLEP
ncbi:MAG: hypothetical protein M1607_04040 [Patescibacteria group bacterium]|nr:hypothetical protein [Patescibacteria group bacterium]